MSKYVNPIWKHYQKSQFDNCKKAICNVCKKNISYQTTISNLKSHLRSVHPFAFDELIRNRKNQQRSSTSGNNADSNSSVKFSSEILAQFEQEDEVTRCALCKKTTENTMEDMRSHLEEEHPAVLINILRKEAAQASDNDQSGDESQHDNQEEAYTEILYLEEEPENISKQNLNPLKRRRPSRQQLDKTPEKSKVTYKVVNMDINNQDTDHIESFLNYIKVLLKNVPKESFPKLQLDVISLILNSQMITSPSMPQVQQPSMPQVQQPSMPQVPLGQQPSMPQLPSMAQALLVPRPVSGVGSMATVSKCEATSNEMRVHSVASTADYRITIESKDK